VPHPLGERTDRGVELAARGTATKMATDECRIEEGVLTVQQG